MSYELRILPSAEKDLRKLPRSTVSAIWNKIESLSQAPFPSGAVFVSWRGQIDFGVCESGIIESPTKLIRV